MAGFWHRALCYFANEVDGMEWRTLVDGNREAPILLNTSTVNG